MPEAVPRLLGADDREADGRAMQAPMGMVRTDIAALEAGFAGR